ncbi:MULTISPECIES: YeeE/YedE family protein [Halorussus]|uniref:YeeE/YedE family protein n=1 Tax=Halorussus TaxID=1070314 RepID=UPI00209F7232|nr:YeeE/YedE family protein [Halorussus vallis]USZ75793.1 YeeE/YedE family protein [Halorussus vallis]
MVSQLLLAAVVGIGLGVFLQKGRFCFVHAFRDLFAFKDSRVTKGVLAATTLTMLFWSIAYELGYYQGFWTPGWGLTGLVGGFVFGIGMTYAGGCASGTLYRAGQGYLHFWLTLAAMGVGYAVFTVLFPTLKAVYFEPLTFGEGLSLFTVSPVPAPVLALLVTVGVVFVYATVVGRERRRAEEGDADRAVAADGGRPSPAPVAGFRSLVGGTRRYLAGFREIDDWVAASKRPWNPITAALGITAIAVVWFTQVSIVGITGPEARWTGYLLQQVGVDSGSFAYWGSVLFKGNGVRLTVDMVMIVAVIFGAFLAAYWSGDFSIRVPKRRRLPNAIGGGFLMGAGSRLAPGCNIGNIYSGLAELSVHSFVATVGIVAGVYVMTHWIYRDVGCAV